MQHFPGRWGNIMHPATTFVWNNGLSCQIKIKADDNIKYPSE